MHEDGVFTHAVAPYFFYVVFGTMSLIGHYRHRHYSWILNQYFALIPKTLLSITLDLIV